jgi:hypothetical protein
MCPTVPRHLRRAALALAVAAAGCGSEPSTGTAGAGEAASAETPDNGTLRGVTVGDRACYLTLEDATGESHEVMADFLLCQSEPLVGQRVRLTYRDAEVAAESCQGDPACTETETVRLAQSIERID